MLFHSFTNTCKVLMLILLCSSGAVGIYLYQRQSEPKVVVVEQEEPAIVTLDSDEPIAVERETAPQEEALQVPVTVEPIQESVKPVVIVEQKPVSIKQPQKPQAAPKKTEQLKPVAIDAKIPPVAVSTPVVQEPQPQAQVDDIVGADEIDSSVQTRRTVTCKNLITKNMTGYRKMGRTWYPDEYYLSCNGVELAEGESMDFEVNADNTCDFSFFYDFRPMGPSYKKGTEDLRYHIPENIDQIEVSFSWYEKPTIMVKAHASQQ